MKKKIYLANSYGFSKQSKGLLKNFIKIFKNLNLEVYEPFERTKDIYKKDGNWAYEIAKNNYIDLEKSDCIFAIVNGNPPDEGVMIELGIAIALVIPISNTTIINSNKLNPLYLFFSHIVNNSRTHQFID